MAYQAQDDMRILTNSRLLSNTILSDLQGKWYTRLMRSWDNYKGHRKMMCVIVICQYFSLRKSNDSETNFGIQGRKYLRS